MVRIAIVEDEAAAVDVLLSYLKKFEEENNTQFIINAFDNAENFLTGSKTYDIVFMDIELPSMNGMDAAARLRGLDKQAVLIFVTNLVRYAVKGYEVDAMDFMLKPISYYSFNLKMIKALGIADTKKGFMISVPQAGGVLRISSKDIFYIEVIGHKLKYHTADGTVDGWGSLSELDSKLKPRKFMRCNRCYLVNPVYIKLVDRLDITMMNGDVLQISHPQKRAFMTEFAEWLGEGHI